MASAPFVCLDKPVVSAAERGDVQAFDGLATWKSLVRKNKSVHGLDYDEIIKSFSH